MSLSASTRSGALATGGRGDVKTKTLGIRLARRGGGGSGRGPRRSWPGWSPPRALRVDGGRPGWLGARERARDGRNHEPSQQDVARSLLNAWPRFPSSLWRRSAADGRQLVAEHVPDSDTSGDESNLHSAPFGFMVHASARQAQTSVDLPSQYVHDE